VEKYFPIAQWTRKIEHTNEAKKLSVSANVLAKKAHKAVIDALFLDDNGEWIKHEWTSYIGAKNDGDPPANHKWKKYAGTVEIPENTKSIVIGLQMYGPGTVWFDELEVAYASDDNQTKAASGKPDPLKAEDLIAEGWKLWGQRKLAEAETKFKEAIRNDPDNDGAYQGLGWAQFNQGKSKNAEVSFKKCVKLNPQNSAALNGLGWIEHGQGNIDKAILWWEKAVKESNGTATAPISGLTKVYMDKKKYGKAIKYYEMWLKAEPNSQEAKDGLEKANQKKPLASIEDIDRLIKELGNPDAPQFVALNRLIDLGQPAVDPLLKAMKTSYNWQIPKALGAIGHKKAIGPLIKKWEKNNTSPMKDVIAESLEKISGQKHGDNLKSWKNWWKNVNDTYTPEATIVNFMKAAIKFDVAKAMSYVDRDSHDFDDTKEIFENSEHPFYLLFKKTDASVPVKVTKADISDTMCEAVWEFTLKEDFDLGGKLKLKAGDTFELDGNLHRYGDKWLITGI